MTFKPTVMIAAGLTGALFVLVVSMDWLRAMFPCEGFGCIGLGMIYLLIAAWVVVVFWIGGALLGPAPRWASGLFAGGMAALAMGLAFVALFYINQARIARDWQRHEAACAQYPQLCPEDARP